MELHELMGKLHKLELVQQLAHRRGAQEHGLYFGQMPVLDFIAANPGCTQVQVADHLRVSPASIGALYKAFAEGGVSHKRSGCRKLTLQAALYLRRRAKGLCHVPRAVRPDRRGGVSGLFGRRA